MSFDELLINEVRSRPCLYDMSRPDYRDLNVKSNNWNEIGELLQVSGQHAKDKWKNMRDRFVKYKNKLSDVRSGAAGGSCNKWALYDVLSFLEPFIQHRRTSSNFDDEISLTGISGVETFTESSHLQNFCETPNSSSTKRKKEDVSMRILKILENDNQEEDPEKQFLLSLLPQMKRLTPEKLSATEMKIMKVLHEAGFEV